MPDVPETRREAFERGEVAGQIAARLAAHDRHFERINGSVERVARELHALNMGMQAVVDKATAAAETVVTTADALAKAEAARRAEAERSWSPLARLSLILGVLLSLLALYAYTR